MEKETRTNKYKDLRESVENQKIDENKDEFLSFLNDEQKEDSLMRPLSYETLDEDEEIKTALSQAKINLGKDAYNTRLDILNKIKQDVNSTPVNIKKFDQDDLSEGYDTGRNSEKMTVMEQLNEMSQPQSVPKEEEKVEEKTEVVEEVKEIKEDPVVEKVAPIFEESTPVTLSKKEIKELKKQEKEAIKQEKKQTVEKKKVEKSHKGLNIFLNIIITLLVLVIVAFIVYTGLNYFKMI